MTTRQTYYKATRQDGTDFYTGTIPYGVGKRVRPAPHEGQRMICGPGLLHAADVPAMTLVGGTWPCRLFEVTGRPVAGFDSFHKHKGGFKELRVVRELPAHLALGPNGELVAEVIERSRQATREEILRLSAARGAAWNAAWDAARDAAWNAAWNAARGAARNAAWNAARGAAWNAARGAVWGLIVKDLISQEHLDILAAPWVEVFGPIG